MRHGMVVDKVLDVSSFKRNMLLEIIINFKFQKKNRAANDFIKDFHKLVNNAFYWIAMENVRNRCELEIIRKEDTDKTIKQQSKLTFNGIYS